MMRQRFVPTLILHFKTTALQARRPERPLLRVRIRPTIVRSWPDGAYEEGRRIGLMSDRRHFRSYPLSFKNKMARLPRHDCARSIRVVATWDLRRKLNPCQQH